MEFFIQQIYALEEQLQLIELEHEDVLIRAEIAGRKCVEVLTKVKSYVLQNDFETEQEEVRFFKEIKPQILSKLIYYLRIYKMEAKRLRGHDKMRKKSLRRELHHLKHFFKNNSEFYKYYQTESTHLDSRYFLRGRHDIKLTLDSYSYEADPRFSTGYDYMLAKIIAHDMLERYLRDELLILERRAHAGSGSMQRSKLTWTESKTALIELIYVLQASGAINEGAVDIKTLAEQFELTFNIDLGEYYRTYMEIKDRKSGYTKFLDTLKENFVRQMDD